MNKRLIINADDFGLCDGVNEAVRKAHTEGVLTSATIMTNMPKAAPAVEMAKKMPNLGTGVHLNLTEGKPLSKDNSVSCLVNADGEFGWSPARLAVLSLISRKIRTAVKTELAAQIQWFIDSGLRPTHLDSHKHFHSFPIIFPIVCSLAEKFGVAAVRWSFEPKQVSSKPWPLLGEGGRKRAKLIRFMAGINRMQNSQLLKTQALVGIAHTGRIDVNFFKAVSLYSPAETAEVMTHPGFINGLDPARTRLIQQRKVELDALCSQRTKQYFDDAGVKLVHYGQI